MAKVTKQTARKKRPVKKKVSKTTRSSTKDRGGFLSGIRPAREPDSGYKVALYGKSGTGKTTFACSFPGKKLLIRCGMDDGERSIFNVENLEVSPLVKKSTDLDEIIQAQKEEQIWDTLILDTASEFRMVCLAEVLELDSVPTHLSWGIARMDQYGDAALGTKSRLRDLLDFADLGTNVIVVAQEGNAGERDSDTELLAPSVAQDLGKSTVGFLNPACDYVVQTFIRPKPPKKIKKQVKSGGKTKTITREIEQEGYDYCLRINIHDVFTVKFRKPKGTQIPDVITDPNYDKFHAIATEKSC